MKKTTVTLILFVVVFAQSWAQKISNFDAKKISGTHHLARPNVQATITKGNSTSATIGGLGNSAYLSNLSQVKYSEDYKSIYIYTPFYPSPASDADWKAEAQTYLKSVANYVGLNNKELGFIESKTETDALGFTHARLTQTYLGYPVWGKEIALHFKNKNGVTANGNLVSNAKTSNKILKLNEQQASSIAIKNIKTQTGFYELSTQQKQLLDYEKPIAEIMYYPSADNTTLTLVYHLTIRPNFVERWEYFVDAGSGAIIHSYNNTCSDGPKTASGTDLNGDSRNFGTYLVGSDYYLIDASRTMFNSSASNIPNKGVGTIETYDMRSSTARDWYFIRNTSNSFSAKEISAHANTTFAYEYYRTEHGRNSIDGKGGTVYAIINVLEADGTEMDNAYWNGKAMHFGNGNKAFTPFQGSLDITGHELTHGVVENTAALVYQDESGAINESIADIFGCMMDSSDWQIMEDIVKKSYFPSGAARDLSNPHNGGSQGDNGWQPNNVSEQYKGTNDHGGVHTNSGIPNYAFYLYATKTNRRLAAKVFYRALSFYLTKSSSFIDLRNDVVQAAEDLYGKGSTAAVEAGKAFDGVGIKGNSSVVTPKSLKPIPGPERILSYATDQADTATLYIGDSLAKILWEPITSTKLISKPSIADDGTYAVFVGEDSTLKYIELVTPYKVGVLQSQKIWKSVAISKDRKHIAAVTQEADTSIWLYDFDIKKWNRLMLYNPTYSGTKSTGVDYADALEFSHDGTSIMYDAHNKIERASSTTLEYWDIGFIDVWDNSAKKFGTGNIDKLVSKLPDGISVGNPTFSKNSPYIIAFDLYDDDAKLYRIVGANLLTGDSSTITTNVIYGYPSYSRLDDKIIYSAVNGLGDYVAAKVDLNADKITAKGSASILIKNSFWPQYFALGTRSLILNAIEENTKPTALQNAKILLYPNPTNSSTIIEVVGVKSSSQICITDILGKIIITLNRTPNIEGKIKEVLDISMLPKGMYLINVNTQNGTIVGKLMKE